MNNQAEAATRHIALAALCRDVGAFLQAHLTLPDACRELFFPALEPDLQEIVAVAARLSLGLAKTPAPAEPAPLRPLFAQLDPERGKAAVPSGAASWHYEPLPVDATSIFPVQDAPGANKDGAVGQRKQLCEDFLRDLGRLANRDNESLWMQHFDSLLHRYMGHIPAAGADSADVPLYDHAHATAALAAALHLFHREENTLNPTDIQSDGDKFLLVSGDFYGIQEFIFSSGDDTGANRSKLLRGRSFYVSLFTDLAADLLCREIGLPPIAPLLNAAGKFTVLAPNTPAARQAIDKARDELNRHLYRFSYGQSGFGLVATPASQGDFVGEAFAQRWSRHKKDMERAKANRLDFDRFGGAVADYLDSFRNDLNPPLCPLCGIRPSSPSPDSGGALRGDRASCALCRDHVFLGTNLVKGKLTLILDQGGTGGKGDLEIPLLGRYGLAFASEEELGSKTPQGALKIWQTNAAQDGSLAAAYTNRLLNGHVPVYSETDRENPRLNHKKRHEEDLVILREGVENGWPKTFQDIALAALEPDEGGKLTGVPALGVLKADVDHLGVLMAFGLPRERLTFARMAALSRQLDSFFAVYLPQVLRNEPKFADIYTVFAGGDDLFLIGPWNRMAELALALRDKFAAFVCENEKIHFSAGIFVAKPMIPVSRLAGQAEEALELSKKGGPHPREGEEGRNRLTVFGETLRWDEMERLIAAEDGPKAKLEQWHETRLSRAFYYRLNELVGMAAEEKRLTADGPVHYRDMHCLRWRALLQYQLARNLKVKDDGDRERALEESQTLAVWMTQYGGAIRIPLWHVLYGNRIYSA